MFFIACAFKRHVHVFAGRMKVVIHLSCWTSAILKYFCPLKGLETSRKSGNFEKDIEWQPWNFHTCIRQLAHESLLLSYQGKVKTLVSLPIRSELSHEPLLL